MYNIVKIYIFKNHSSDTTKQGSALLYSNIYKLLIDLAHIHNIPVIPGAPQGGPNYWINGVMCSLECIPLLRCVVKRPSVIHPLKSPCEWCKSKISKQVAPVQKGKSVQGLLKQPTITDVVPVVVLCLTERKDHTKCKAKWNRSLTLSTHTT